MRWINISCIFCLAMNLGCHKESADLIVFNGEIYTVNNRGDVAGAMVVRSGLVVEVGSESALKSKYHAAEEIDLHGKYVFPGFIDPHCHFFHYGLSMRQADLTGSVSQEEIGSRLQTHIKSRPASWVLGRGWDQNDWKDKQFPHKEFLDALFPDVPVYLARVDGHAAWVNSRALKLAHIHAGMTIEGGEIITDSHGATGILIDNAMSLVEKLIPSPTREEKIQALIRSQKDCFSVGLTTVGDAGLDRDMVTLMDSLQKNERLNMRIYAMLNPTPENISYFITHGVYRTDRLSVRSVKLYADGALGSRGALLKKEYSDDPGNRGIQLTPTGFLNEICRMAFSNGYQVNTHCIGDSAVSLILRLYAGIIPEHNDLRWRIEHAQVVDTIDLPLFGQYAIIPSIQTTHATSDMYWAEDRLGAERIAHAYAYRTLLAQNGWLANGSDFPVESINPLYGFYAAVARKDLKGFPQQGYRKQESLTRLQALQAMTIWAAKACFEEKDKGSLESGKFADFVVLGQDIMKAEEDSIPEIKVLETYVGGKKM
jgi:predicted amidohydrolase YtcJ